MTLPSDHSPGTDSINCWVAVASAEHVAIGRAGGFMQVGHGKGAPLERLHAGDRVAYYSSVRVFGEKAICQAFTAVGVVRDDLVYQGEMKLANGEDFKPFRKDVSWFKSQEASIRPLLETLSFTAGKTSWGYAFRFGLLKVTAADMDLIEAAMKAVPAKLAPV
jgi:EVE domain